VQQRTPAGASKAMVLRSNALARYYKLKRPVPYQFVLSLPERLARSLGALSGGLLREIGIVLLPSRIRRTALYRLMVEVTLRFLIEELGRVEGIYSTEGKLENFLAKRSASHGIELLGLLTIHVSPIWVLAALADATGAGHSLIQEIAQSLKDEGLLDRNSKFETLDQLLDGLEKTSAHLAETLNLPPVRLTDLRREWTRLKEALPRIPQQNVPAMSRLERMWMKLAQSSAAEERSVFSVCSMLAISAVEEIPANMLWLSRAARTAAKRTGEVVGEALLTHYAQSLEEISRTGPLEYWKREFRPYLRAAAEQFVPENESSTERLLRKRA